MKSLLTALVLLSISGATGFAESIEPTVIDNLLMSEKPASTYWSFGRNDLFHEGSRIYGCQGVADNCEQMSHLVCKKLGFNKAVDFSWSKPEIANSSDFRKRFKEGYIWVLQKNEKGQMEFSLQASAYLPQNSLVFSSLTCSM